MEVLTYISDAILLSFKTFGIFQLTYYFISLSRNNILWLLVPIVLYSVTYYFNRKLQRKFKPTEEGLKRYSDKHKLGLITTKPMSIVLTVIGVLCLMVSIFFSHFKERADYATYLQACKNLDLDNADMVASVLYASPRSVGDSVILADIVMYTVTDIAKTLEPYSGIPDDELPEEALVILEEKQKDVEQLMTEVQYFNESLNKDALTTLWYYILYGLCLQPLCVKYTYYKRKKRCTA